ncbi:MAG: C1 family peptidase [bacterium]|nr:C1 family peptidase [bacterium]
MNIKSKFMTSLFLLLFSVTLFSAPFSLVTEQSGLTLYFPQPLLKEPIGCIYLNNEFLTALSEKNISDGNITLNPSLSDKINQSDKFTISILIQGTFNKNIIEITNSAVFSYKNSKTQYISETTTDNELKLLAFKRFNELRNIRKAIIDNNAHWTAGLNKIFMLPDEKRNNLFQGMHQPTDSTTQKSSVSPLALPDSFDWHTKDGKDWMSPVKDQGSVCGSCWAFGAVGVAEAATNIGENNPDIDLDLAEQTLVTDCCVSCGDCAGGNDETSLLFIKSTGLPLESCDPYTACNGVCDRCTDWLAQTRKITTYAKGQAGSGASNINVSKLQTALSSGPISSYMNIYQDFLSYTSGIYNHLTGTVLGAHIVVLTGWNNKDSCFNVKNSWSPTWGENGYFRIKYKQCSLGYFYCQATYTALSVNAGKDTSILAGDSITLSPTIAGGAPDYSKTAPNNYTYNWTPSLGLSNPTIKTPKASPSVATNYILTVTDLNVSKSDTVKVTVSPEMPTLIAPDSGHTTNDSTPSFVWHKSTGATKYRIKIDSDSTEISDTSFTSPALSKTTHLWKVKAGNNTGKWSPYSTIWQITVNSVEIQDTSIATPKIFFISNNYPNPFTNSTTIEYGLPINATVTINIYNSSGQKIITLLNKTQNAGYYTLVWDGKDNSGKKAAAGIYFYILKTMEFTSTKKIMYLIK